MTKKRLVRDIAHWDTDGPRGRKLKVEMADHFDARGMRCIYGRGDWFTRRSFHMDVWATKDGRILARFWAYTNDVDTESYEVFGLTPVPPDPTATNRFSELNVPELLRWEYDNWILCYL